MREVSPWTPVPRPRFSLGARNKPCQIATADPALVAIVAYLPGADLRTQAGQNRFDRWIPGFGIWQRLRQPANCGIAAASEGTRGGWSTPTRRTPAMQSRSLKLINDSSELVDGCADAAIRKPLPDVSGDRLGSGFPDAFVLFAQLPAFSFVPS